jgi:hypothetical protein
MLPHFARQATLALLFLLQVQISRTWFHSGELTWRRDNMTVHFELRTAWERTGYPTTLTRMTVRRAPALTRCPGKAPMS